MTKERNLAILDAPSNLGPRPPEEGAVPGCYKLPWALRDKGLLGRLGAEDAGGLAPPRYRAEWQPGDGDRNAGAIAAYSVTLADRLASLLDKGLFPVVLGGDCSILLGSALALRRRGRYGLVFLDAHSDFRYPDNEPAIGAAAGEDLAIVTGRGDARLTNLESRKPYVRDEDVHLVGVKVNDEHLEEVRGLGMGVSDARAVQTALPGASSGTPSRRRRARRTGSGFTSIWTSLTRVRCPRWTAPSLTVCPSRPSARFSGLSWHPPSASGWRSPSMILT